MLVIRPVKHSDLSDLLFLAEKAGKGMTSLPTDPEILSEKIDLSIASFSKHDFDKNDYFLLVMEDTQSNRAVGTAALYSHTGARQAFYAYRLMPITHYSHTLDTRVQGDILQLSNDYSACSEVGSLFLDPDYRGNGHWLAKTRYLFMSIFKQRFEKHVIAELRGWLDENGQSPFWDAIGRQFFAMSFDEADALCGRGSNQFITELMPKYPIYTCFLPESARSVIGKPHDHGKRAMSLLEEEGFYYDNVIDIFDGGPLLKVRVDDITTIRNAERRKVFAINEEAARSTHLIANTNIHDFRAVCVPSNSSELDALGLSHAHLNMLGLDEGAPVLSLKIGGKAE